jgi:hypothetical protein
MTPAGEKIKYFVEYPRPDLFAVLNFEEFCGQCTLLCSWRTPVKKLLPETLWLSWVSHHQMKIS